MRVDRGGKRGGEDSKIKQGSLEREGRENCLLCFLSSGYVGSPFPPVFFIFLLSPRRDLRNHDSD